MHNRLPIVSRFMSYRSPYEHYVDRELYGRRVAMWNHPHEHFIKPAYRQIRGSRDILANTMRSLKYISAIIRVVGFCTFLFST